jgi:hypothetical protein
LETIEVIAERYPVSKTTIKDAIHGKNSYANVPDPDTMDPSDKENRVQWRSVMASAKTRKAREIRQIEALSRKLGVTMTKVKVKSVKRRLF